MLPLNAFAKIAVGYRNIQNAGNAPLTLTSRLARLCGRALILSIGARSLSACRARGMCIMANEPVPVFTFQEQQAHDAWLAHHALLMAEIANPPLANNPAWKALRDFAYEQFAIAFQVV